MVTGGQENASVRGPLVFWSFLNSVLSGDSLFMLIKGIYCLRSLKAAAQPEIWATRTPTTAIFFSSLSKQFYDSQFFPTSLISPMLHLVYGFRCSALHDSTITPSAIKLGNELCPESKRKCIQTNLDMNGYILVLGFCEEPLMSNVNPDLCIYGYILYIYSAQ